MIRDPMLSTKTRIIWKHKKRHVYFISLTWTNKTTVLFFFNCNVHIVTAVVEEKNLHFLFLPGLRICSGLFTCEDLFSHYLGKIYETSTNHWINKTWAYFIYAVITPIHFRIFPLFSWSLPNIYSVLIHALCPLLLARQWRMLHKDLRFDLPKILWKKYS